MLSRLRSVFQHRFVRDTLTLQIGQFLLIFIAGASQAIIARTLQKDLFGFYRAILVQFSLFSLVNISGAALISRNQLAQAFGRNDTAAIRLIVGWYLKVSTVVISLLMLFFFITFPVIAGDIGNFARWMVVMPLFDIPYSLLQNVLAARRTMPPLVRLETLRVIVTSLAQIAATLTVRVEALIGVQIAVSILFLPYCVWFYGRLAHADPQLPGWRTALESARRVPFRTHLGQGVIISLDKNLSQFTVETLPLLILSHYSQAQLGLFTTAYQVVTFPAPLISGIARNLDTYIPYKSRTTADFRSTFIRSTLGGALFWSLGTLAVAFAAPFALLILFGFGFTEAVPMLYPLLLQSLAVGYGLGLGSAFRTLGKSQYSIVESLVVTAIMLPIGFWLIQTYGGLGAAWFVGLQWILNAVLGVAIVLWLARPKPTPQSLDNALG